MPDPSESKEDLDRLKLHLEVADLRRSPWAKPSVVVPILAALLTLGLSQYLGVFDVERKRVELQMREAELRRSKLQDELALLEAKTRELEKEKEDLARRRAGLGSEVAKLEGNVRTLRAEADAARHELNRARTVLARPNLTIESFVLVGERRVAVSVINKGLGVAEVRRFHPYVDGRRLPPGPSTESFGPTLDALGINETWVRWHWPASIKASEQSDLLMVEPGQFDAGRAETFRKAIVRLGLEVCYCSVFGDCYWAAFNRPNIEKRTCDADKG